MPTPSTDRDLVLGITPFHQPNADLVVAVTDVTPDRWDPAVYCDEEQASAARFYTRRGGFLGEVATFN